MGKVRVSVSMPKSLLADIDAMAKRDSRSRSELVGDAARSYLRNKSKREWQRIFALGDRLTKRLGLTEADVEEAIRAVREERTKI